MKRGHALLVVPLVAAALVVAWWGPWSSPPDVIKSSRRAFGTERVVHVLASIDVDPDGPAMRPITASEGIEVWYDASRRRMHVVVRRGTKVALDKVETDFEPADVPPLTDLPSPLWEFITGYRSTLARRRYHVARSAWIRGRRVVWLSAPALRTPRTLLVVAETKPYDPTDFPTAKQKKPRHL